MKSNEGRCALCGGPHEPGTTVFAVDLKTGVVVVRGVPARVCSQCGEAWIEDAVAPSYASSAWWQRTWPSPESGWER